MQRKPDWLKVSLPQGKKYLDIKEIIEKKNFILYVWMENVLTYLNVGGVELLLL